VAGATERIHALLGDNAIGFDLVVLVPDVSQADAVALDAADAFGLVARPDNLVRHVHVAHVASVERICSGGLGARAGAVFGRRGSSRCARGNKAERCSASK
jgi:hypothetical protein